MVKTYAPGFGLIGLLVAIAFQINNLQSAISPLALCVAFGFLVANFAQWPAFAAPGVRHPGAGGVVDTQGHRRRHHQAGLTAPHQASTWVLQKLHQQHQWGCECMNHSQLVSSINNFCPILHKVTLYPTHFSWWEFCDGTECEYSGLLYKLAAYTFNWNDKNFSWKTISWNNFSNSTHVFNPTTVPEKLAHFYFRVWTFVYYFFDK